MKRAIIGCGMIRKDIEELLDGLGYEAQQIWLDETLHNSPQKLHDELQRTIDGLTDCDEILLTYLMCGNAIVGLKSDRASLRFLKGDDCIYACLCGREDYRQLRTRSIFLSRGWLSNDRNPLQDYRKSVERYGEERTAMIYEMMYGNYQNAVFMKLHPDEPSGEDLEKLDDFCRLLDLKPRILEGDIGMYRRLLSLEECPEVTVVPPGRAITMKDCGLFA